ncbi:MAG TPA: zf-HC2 domain-containing protein [Chloroflexota bacterium]
MQPPSHIDDDALSAFADQELSPDDLARTSSHLETCSECQERLDGLQSVASLLRQLPDLEVPRDFALGRRLLGDPPNVVRLQRWYAAARASAALLAAGFVFLLAGTLYLSAQPAAHVASSAARPAVLSAPATSAPAAAARSETAPGQSQVPAAPAPAPAPPAAGQASAASAHPAPVSPQSDDQVAAETTVSPLPTPLPPPVPTMAAAPVAAAVATAESGPGAVLGLGALVVGILAIVALLIALVVRHRLQRASTA